MNKIKILELELSAKCNAACPQCPREIPHIKSFLQSQNEEITLLKIKNWFNIEFLNNLETITFKGTYSEPIIAVDFLKILEYFIKNTTAKINISTNGSLRKKEFWHNLGQTLGERGTVIFGIDGLEDTHSIYRVNTDYNKIIENARAFIDAGGHAEWQFICFKHNEHQINRAISLAQEYKFKNFFLVASPRFESIQKISITNNKGQELEKSTEYNAPTWSDIHDNFKNTKSVDCESKKLGWILVDWSGEVFPCCYSQIWKKNINKMKIDNQIWYKKVVGEKNSTNLNYNTIENILEKLDFFYNNLNKSFIPGICAWHCGDKKLDSYRNKLNITN